MQVQLLQERIDALYQDAFQGVDRHLEGKEELEGFDLLKLQNVSEAAFGQLGRTQPKASRYHAVRSVTTAGWHYTLTDADRFATVLLSRQHVLGSSWMWRP